MAVAGRSMTMRRCIRWVIVPGILLLAAAGFLDLRQRCAVDWRDVRPLVLESDDWGLCGYTPSLDAVSDLADLASISTSMNQFKDLEKK